MTVRSVLRMGDPRLLQPAAPVTAFGTRELAALIADMLDTMAAEGGVGRAPPQNRGGLRHVLFGVEDSHRDTDAPPVPMTVLANPVITPLGDETEDGWEGCLSVPGLRGVVPRHTRIRYRGFTPDGEPIDRIAEGFHARVVQHECDHLDGTLYPMRVRDFARFGFTDVLFPELGS